MRGLISQGHPETSMFPAFQELNLRGVSISTRQKEDAVIQGKFPLGFAFRVEFSPEMVPELGLEAASLEKRRTSGLIDE